VKGNPMPVRYYWSWQYWRSPHSIIIQGQGPGLIQLMVYIIEQITYHNFKKDFKSAFQLPPVFPHNHLEPMYSYENTHLIQYQWSWHSNCRNT